MSRLVAAVITEFVLSLILYLLCVMVFAASDLFRSICSSAVDLRVLVAIWLQ